MRLLEICKNCGKESMHHQAKSRACPGGRRSRTHGYPFFYRDRVFEARTRPNSDAAVQDVAKRDDRINK